EMLVWGGIGSNLEWAQRTGNGARYQPETDTWSPISGEGAPTQWSSHSAVWTGRQMLVWGGFDRVAGTVNTGARYDPAADTWQPMVAPSGPSQRPGHSAV